MSATTTDKKEETIPLTFRIEKVVHELLGQSANKLEEQTNVKNIKIVQIANGIFDMGIEPFFIKNGLTEPLKMLRKLRRAKNLDS